MEHVLDSELRVWNWTKAPEAVLVASAVLNTHTRTSNDEHIVSAWLLCALVTYELI